jgi:hypothetical protein
MTDLPTLEAALFQKELDTLAAKLAPLVQGIRDVFAEYGDSNGNIAVTPAPTADYNARVEANQTEVNEIGEWLRSLPQVELGYHAGTVLKVRNVSLKDLPLSLERAIRLAAIRKHLEGVATPPRPPLPEPMTEAPGVGVAYFRPAPENCTRGFMEHNWCADNIDYAWLAQRFCYATAEDAIAVTKAMLETLNPAKP